MSPYVVIPLLSCIVCAMLAAILYTRDRKQPANRLASALMGCTAFWAFCEVLWNQSSDAAQVLYLVKLAVFGWAPLGATGGDAAKCPTPDPRRAAPSTRSRCLPGPSPLR